MKSYKKFAVILSALIVSSLFLTGCNNKNIDSNSVVYYTSQNNMLGNDDTENNNNDNDNSSAVTKKTDNVITTPAEPVTYVEGSIGDTIEQSGISATLEKAEISIEKTADNTILMYAIFDIKNVTDQDLTINRLNNFTVSIDGAEPLMSTITSSTARSAVNGKITDIQKFDGTITSGNSLKGYLTFEVPVETSEITLIYYPYQYSATKSNNLGYQFKFNVADMTVMK